MNFLEIIKNSINNLCAKYIERNLSDEMLPIFYVAGSQTLPAPLEQKEEEEKPQEKKPQEWLVITIPEGKEDLRDDIVETLTFYEGDVNVGLKVGGKKLHLKNIKVRRCNALESELQTFIDEGDYKFFTA